MSRFLGIDWDHAGLYLVTGTIGRKEAHVERAVLIPEAHTLDVAAAEEAGRRLRQRLKDAKIVSAPVLACLGRERVILKELRFPAVEPDREAALIQFQATKELTEPANRVVIDYTHSKFTANGKDRLAILSIARKQWLLPLQALCKGAGLTLACVTPRPYGIARCLNQGTSATVAAPAPAPGTSVAVLTLSRSWAEFSIIRDGEVRLARPIAQGDNVLEDVRRNLALYANQSPTARDSAQALYFIGDDEHAVLVEKLREALAIPVHALDPFAKEEHVQVSADRGGFTGLVGLADLWAEQKTPINFISPKEPKPENKNSLRTGVLAAALLIVLLFGGFVIGQIELGKKEKEVQERKQKLGKMAGQLEALKPDQAKLAALQQWDESAMPWVDQLLDLTRRFPQEKGFHVTQLQVSTLPGAADKQGHTMQLRIKGLVPLKKSHLVYQLIDNLNEHESLQAKLDHIKESNRGSEGSGNAEEFEIIVLVARHAEVDKANGGKHSPPAPGKNKGSKLQAAGN